MLIIGLKKSNYIPPLETWKVENPYYHIAKYLWPQDDIQKHDQQRVVWFYFKARPCFTEQFYPSNLLVGFTSSFFWLNIFTNQIHRFFFG